MAAGPADKALDVFKTLVFDALVKNLIAYIVGLAPFLSFGPVAFIVGKVVTYIAGKLYEGLRDVINIEVIILRNAAAHAAFVDAQLSLRNVALTKGIDSKEFQDARNKQAEAFANFILNPIG